MLILKNSFIFMVSVFAILLLIIIFDKIGMNKSLNLVVSAFIYGSFITVYFQKVFLSLSLFLVFYTLLFMISYSLEVIVMLLISCSALFLIEFVMPKLKEPKKHNLFVFDWLYKR